ncbi:MAG: hypothetical protein ACTSRG_11565 [Candidatus Helarchaeota archaeon]
MSSSLEEKLEKILEKSKDWSKNKTSIPGLFIVKIPGSKTKPPLLAIELNPADNMGNPKKRRGIYIMNFEEFKLFKNILNNEKTEALAKAVENLKSKQIGKISEEQEIIEL